MLLRQSALAIAITGLITLAPLAQAAEEDRRAVERCPAAGCHRYGIRSEPAPESF